MDTDSFVLSIFTEDFFEDINNDVDRWFDTSNFDENDKRPLQIGINKNVIGMFKDELGGKVMKEFCALRAKIYTYLLEDDSEMKKAKGVKRCVVKRRLMFENYKDSLFNNKTIMRSQLRFKSDHHNVYTEEVNKIALNSSDNKRLQTFDRIKTYPYGTNAFKVCESEMLSKTRCHVKIINFVVDIVNENKTAHNKNWTYIPDHRYRILIIGGSGCGKTNALINVIENQPDIDKIYFYAKDPCEPKYQYMINKREGVGINHFNDLKAFIDYSNGMCNVYRNINYYNADKENKILIVFDDMIADMIQNKKLNSIVTELFIRGRKLNIFSFGKSFLKNK